MNMSGAERAADTSLPQSNSFLKHGNSTLLEIAPAFIEGIISPENVTFSRLEWPAPTGDRYDYLRSNATNTPLPDSRPKYFALNLHQYATLLHRLIGSILETMRFLGPRHLRFVDY